MVKDDVAFGVRDAGAVGGDAIAEAFKHARGDLRDVSAGGDDNLNAVIPKFMKGVFDGIRHYTIVKNCAIKVKNGNAESGGRKWWSGGV